MKSLRPLAALAAVALAATLAACGTTEEAPAQDKKPTGGPVSVTDARGKTIELDSPAVRVAATEWNTVEYLISLGVQPVGVADIKGFKTWNSSVELDSGATDIGTRGEPSTDTLATLDLDAVIVTDELVGDAVAQIEKTIPVIVVPGGKAEDPIGQMFANVDLVAKVVGKEEAADELRKDFDEALAETKKAVEASDAAGATVAFNDAYDMGGGSVYIRPYTEGSLLGAILKDLGFANGWEGIDGLEGDPAYGLAQTDVEGLTKLLDDTLFWYIGGEGEADVYGEVLKDNKVWKGLPFVAAGNVTRIPDKIWMFGGPKSMEQFLDAVTDAVA